MQSFPTSDYPNKKSKNASPINMDIEETIKQVRTGDANALARLIEAYSPMVRKVCSNITDEDEDTLNDVVQVVFIRAYYSLHQLRDTDKFGEWLCAIAKNEALKLLKHKQKRMFTPFSSFTNEEFEVEECVTPENWLEEKEIHEIIAQLPTGYRKVFQMAVIEGYSHKEIAKILGIAPHSSSSQLARAKAMLRKIINKRMLAIVSFFLISIPLYRILWRKPKIENGHTHTAQVEHRKKGRKQHITKKQMEEMPTRGKRTENVAANMAHQNIPQTKSNSMLANDTIQIHDSLSSHHIAETEFDSTATDTVRNIWQEYGKTFIAEDRHISTKHKWQLLAAGSLGSSLVQNAYKMLASNIGSGLPDTDAPASPNRFSTWEECYHYLQMKEQETLSEEEKALMEIALNNKNNTKNDGKIVEHERHDNPITFGLSVTKSLENKWGVTTGLQYSLLKSDFTLGEDAYYIKRNQKVHYLGLPLHASYRWLDAKNWSIYSSLGVTLHIPVYGKTDEKYVTGQTTPYSNSWHFTPSLQWTIDTSAGVQYHFSPNWGIYLEPSLNWHLQHGSSVHTRWTEHPFTFTVPFGIRFTW